MLLFFAWWLFSFSVSFFWAMALLGHRTSRNHEPRTLESLDSLLNFHSVFLDTLYIICMKVHLHAWWHTSLQYDCIMIYIIKMKKPCWTFMLCTQRSTWLKTAKLVSYSWIATAQPALACKVTLMGTTLMRQHAARFLNYRAKFDSYQRACIVTFSPTAPG